MPHKLSFLPNSFVPYCFYDEFLRKDSKSSFMLASDDSVAQEWLLTIKKLLPESKKETVIYIPAWDCLPYDRSGPSYQNLRKRAKAIQGAISNSSPIILILTPQSLLQGLPPKSFWEESSLELKVNDNWNVRNLIQHLTQKGYRLEEVTRTPGDISIRGGIVDIFPTTANFPFRMEFWGENIDSIKVFDPMTQLTLQGLDSITVSSPFEYPSDSDSFSFFRHAYRDFFGTTSEKDFLYQSIKGGGCDSKIWHYQPLFWGGMANALDFLNGNFSVFVPENYAQLLSGKREEIETHFKTRKNVPEEELVSYRPLPPDMLYLNLDETSKILEEQKNSTTIYCKGDIDGGVSCQAKPLHRLSSQTPQQYIETQRNKNKAVFVFSENEHAFEKLTSLSNTPILKKTPQDLLEEKIDPGIYFVQAPLLESFEAPDYCALSAQDLWGTQQVFYKKKKVDPSLLIKDLSTVTQGDFVVHEQHGIGRFEGLETVHVGPVRHDCLRLVYEGGDRLFIPVENLDILTRYGHEDSVVQLDKIGGAAWQARKAKVKKQLLEVAGELIDLAAERALKRGPSVHVPGAELDEFSATFPFTETDDQLRAIEEVLQDLTKPQPMDRLICGDVGFGKTEVAMRAAFQVAMSGFQVAVVVPTTLLARQHYENFKDRFQKFAIRVESLSRLVSPAHAKKVKEGLEKGQVDIVIGTHALLAESMKFKNMGLLVIDEEQRFGVKQKEKLKELRKDVHVLTMTATPIPRTLQLSLTGVKELSLITTPPVDRMSVRTFVMPYDRLVIREAILREKHRGGQVFYVCPRIRDIDEVVEQLEKHVPEASFAVAHGQMPGPELESIMEAFTEGKFDILISTQIVESGIDIANANTLILHRADMFGLAQLYQLRGRVGRSKAKAYAYLTLPQNKVPTKDAQKRLEVMQTLDHLGAGFSLASYDLDISGAGNLLGEEQSGHIKEVGIELYQQMLEEAVVQRKEALPSSAEAEESLEHYSPQINMGVSVLIPEEYVADLNLRLSLYKRVSGLVEQDEIKAFEHELQDRFGKIPEEVANLMRIVELKSFARKACVEKIEVGPKGGVITFHKQDFPAPEKLIQLIQSQAGTMKLKPNHDLVIIRAWQNWEARLKGVRELLITLSSLISQDLAA